MIDEKSMTLGRDWSYFTSPDPTGWILTEKLDGCRAYWDGAGFWTRAGLRIAIPDSFKAGLPAEHCDGEIFAGRGQFHAARSAVNHGIFTDAFCFRIFDMPQAAGVWTDRIATAPHTARAEPVAWRVARSKQDVVSEFHAVKRAGGEGLMLRCHVTAGYCKGRTLTLLKVK